MCDFYLEKGDDPSLYAINIGAVDDGVQVMVNGNILGHLVLGQSGSFTLEHARLGEINTLIVILADDSASNKYVRELGFYRDGVLVKG